METREESYVIAFENQQDATQVAIVRVIFVEPRETNAPVTTVNEKPIDFHSSRRVFVRTLVFQLARCSFDKSSSAVQAEYRTMFIPLPPPALLLEIPSKTKHCTYKKNIAADFSVSPIKNDFCFLFSFWILIVIRIVHIV